MAKTKRKPKSRAAAKKSPRKVEHFWLCGTCAKLMTLAYQRGKGVITLPLSSGVRAAVAS